MAPTPTIAPPAVIGRIDAAAAMQRMTSASVGEKPTPSALSRRALPSARVVQQPNRKPPAANVEREMPAWSPTRLKILSSRSGAVDERQEDEPRAEREHGDATEAEEQHDDQRGAEDRAARRDRGDRERQHRDRVDEPEGDDREADRLEAEADAAEPPQRRDLDDVVEPERQHDAARGRGAAGREAPTAVGPLAREQALPAERAKDEAARDRRPTPPSTRTTFASCSGQLVLVKRRAGEEA